VKPGLTDPQIAGIAIGAVGLAAGIAGGIAGGVVANANNDGRRRRKDGSSRRRRKDSSGHPDIAAKVAHGIRNPVVSPEFDATTTIAMQVVPVIIPVLVPGGNRLYNADDKAVATQPDIAAKVDSNASQGMLMGAAAFVFFGCLFLGISGFIYAKTKTKSTRAIKVEEDAEALLVVEE